MPESTLTPLRPTTSTPSRAARELGLKRAEFDLAVQLGRLRTVPDESTDGACRVTRTEIDRLRAQDDFPQAFRDSLRLVATTEGAALLGISPGRFTRLARLGLLVPVRFYLNRYRTVVWQYLAEDLVHFASRAENARLFKGRTPETLRSQVTAGVDLRARNWRGRHLGFLLRQAESSPWARAAALAAFLPPDAFADIVKDPAERIRLDRLLPTPPGVTAPGTPSAQLAAQLMTAQDPDEIAWLRADLAEALREARLPASPETSTAPAPTPAPTLSRSACSGTPVRVPRPRATGARVHPTQAMRSPRRLLTWLRAASRATAAPRTHDGRTATGRTGPGSL